MNVISYYYMLLLLNHNSHYFFIAFNVRLLKALNLKMFFNLT